MIINIISGRKLDGPDHLSRTNDAGTIALTLFCQEYTTGETTGEREGFRQGKGRP